jgi:proteic killer suppression protein
MILNFADEVTRSLANGESVKKITAEVQRQALKRLNFLRLAKKREDLFIPPSNRFHSLEGFSPKRYALWVNHQWRISFEWPDDAVGPSNVKFEDYH